MRLTVTNSSNLCALEKIGKEQPTNQLVHSANDYRYAFLINDRKSFSWTRWGLVILGGGLALYGAFVESRYDDVPMTNPQAEQVFVLNPAQAVSGPIVVYERPGNF